MSNEKVIGKAAPVSVNTTPQIIQEFENTYFKPEGIFCFSVRGAYEFAKIAHHGQVRKFSGLPYIVHPVKVSIEVRKYFEHEPVSRLRAQMAALLHDTVEDTEVTAETIRHIFGDGIEELVASLTKPENSFGNRAARKLKMAEDLAKADNIAKTIKMCDIMDNLPDMAKNDPAFVRNVYLGECKLILKAVEDGHAEASKDAWMVVNTVESSL